MRLIAGLCTLLLAGAAVPSDRGGLSLLVFDAITKLPLAEVPVVIDGQLLGRTDQDGAFWVLLAPGAHQLTIPGDRGGMAQRFGVVAGEETEIILQIQRGGPGVAEVEAPVEAPMAAQTATSARIGTIRGRVIDAEKQAPVAGARVLVRGEAAAAKTDAEGRFSLQVAAGVREVTAIHPDFSTTTARGVQVDADREVTVEVAMLPAMRELGEFVVLAPKITGGTASLLEERRSASNIADLVGAEAMSKSGDADAAGALARVTGITVVGGRYIYVRGLGDRYSSTLLDGSSLPSPDPKGRVVPLDMFPANVLDSVLVEKTYSVDRPAEFGGGTVVLRTRAFPKTFSGELALSLGYVAGSTFEMGPTSGQGGALDFLGFGAGARSLPSEVAAASEASPLREGDMFSARGYTPEELERFGEALPQDFSVQDRRMLPDLGVTASLGGPMRPFDLPGGYSFGLVYKTEGDCCDRHTEELNNESYDFRESDQEVTFGGLFTGGLELGPASRIRYTGLLSRISNDRTAVQEGWDPEISSTKRVHQFHWEERMLVSNQLQGEHPLSDDERFKLDWRYLFSVADLSEPDRRQIRYDLEPGTADSYRLSSRPEGNLRVFTSLLDFTHDLGVSMSLPFAGDPKIERGLKVGADGVLRTRSVDSRRYKLKSKGTLASQSAQLDPSSIFGPDTIGPDGFQLDELSRPSDTYHGDQQVIGGYAQLRWGFSEALSVVGGLRVEHSRQNVETFDPFNPDFEPITADLSTTDLFPALTVSWEFVEDMFLRGGISRTISRPNFREIAPARLKERAGEYEVAGNPELDRALISHFDARWEWYPSRGESISIGGFAKIFDGPIEATVVPGADRVYTFNNADSAVSAGAEVELRKDFGFVAEALEDVFVAGNATFVHSRVQLPPGVIETSAARPLQGQSPYVFNVQLGWDAVEQGTSLVMLYNVYGPRIVAVGAEGVPDRYEEPFHQLDLVFAQDIGAGFKLSFKAKNLIDPQALVTEGERRAEAYQKGRSFSLGISGKF